MSEFVDQLREVFAQFGPIEARQMFGGHGVYHDDLMFGLVVDDVLYLKADGHCSDAFSERSLPRFQYERGSKKSKYPPAEPGALVCEPLEAADWSR